MIKRAPTRGRLFPGGLFLFLALLLVAITGLAAGQNDEEGVERGIKVALDRIEKLKQQDPLNLDALQVEYLILFENFPRREAGKKGIFELYHLWRQNQRWPDAYAVLMKICSVYQDYETMENPGDPRKPINIVATAQIEVAHIFAVGMTNPFTALETLQRALARYPDAIVGTDSSDRSYRGEIGIIARLEMTDDLIATDATNRASAELLNIVRDFAGKKIMLDGMEVAAATAAVLKLPEVMKSMPASLPKRERILETFAQTAVEEEPRVWLKFLEADVCFQAFREWSNSGALEQGIEAYRQILLKHPLVMLRTGTEEPAGVRALRLTRDALTEQLKNPDRARGDLSSYFNLLSKSPKTREIAAYAMLYGAELELDFFKNAPSAFKMFSQVVDDYGDVPLYPRKPGENETLKEHAKRWAERAQQRM